jgi:hypothetical protein
MTKAETIREFMQTAGSTIISVEFIKKDGTPRKIQFNPRDRQGLSGGSPATQDPNIIRIRDFSIARSKVPAWRCFHVDRIVKITSNGQTFEF